MIILAFRTKKMSKLGMRVGNKVIAKDYGVVIPKWFQSKDQREIAACIGFMRAYNKATAAAK